MANPFAKLKFNFIKNKYVLEDELDNNSVKEEHIANQNVTTSKIKDKNITNGKLADASVDNRVIEDESVDNDKIVNDTITFDKMTDDTRYIGVDDKICALIDVGGIKIGDKIDNVSTRDLLKSILTPPTEPELNAFINFNISNCTLSFPGGEQLLTIAGGTKNLDNDTPICVGTQVVLNRVISQVKMKSSMINSISLKVSLDVGKPYDNDIDFDIPFNESDFEADTFMSYLTQIKVNTEVSSGVYLPIGPCNIPNGSVGNISRVTLKATTVDELESNKTVDFITKAPVIWFNYDIDNTGGIDPHLINNPSYDYNIIPNYLSSMRQLELSFPEKINSNSVVMLPVDVSDYSYINSLIDSNGMTQKVNHLKDIELSFNGVRVPYRIYYTEKCTASSKKYIFNLERWEY